METVLTTARLALRRFDPGDAEAFRLLAGDWEVARMTSDIPHPLSLEQAQRWLEPATGETRLAIIAEGALAGGVGYFRRSSGAAELGFWLGRNWWGRGIATEAVWTLVAHGFSAGGQTAMTSSHFVDNPASERVLVKCGFERAGKGHIWSVARGAEVPADFYWLSRERAEAVFDLPRRRPKGRLGALIGKISRSA